ncbi:hypothetical protein K432DRAFT_212376 [Lepidopterella palustris CBS 459.81]|uniref:Uncharacterized protein n=1 Tax=Lepidopterella palustris CBS 459.81 TaxID=1314670 RepID=A0A8E2EF85_9PEZI|nr:hypothetical protein K432DRAFT_212376 [Lepidopterella palustris CBS 459.81]
MPLLKQSEARFGAASKRGNLPYDPLSEDHIFQAFCPIRFLDRNTHFDLILHLQADILQPINTYRTNAFRAVHWVLALHWWRRIWEVQEPVPPRTATILYGRVQAPWGMFLEAVDIQRYHT